MRSLAAVLLLLVPLGAAGASLEATASLEEGGKVRISLEGPPGAVLTLWVCREFVVPAPVPEIQIHRSLLGLDRSGRGGILVPLEEARTPGRYRLHVSCEAAEQPPEVARPLGDGMPKPVSVLAADALASPEYLRAVLDEQERLAGAFRKAGEYLDRLADLQVAVAEDREKGLAAWEAWRTAANREIDALIQKGRSQATRYYPTTHAGFTGSILYRGIRQCEPRMYSAARSGRPFAGTGAFRDRPITHRDLEPFFDHVFLKETLAYRLVVFKDLAAEVAAETDPDRRKRRRARWDEVLALWGTRLEGHPQKQDLEGLGRAFSAWLDALQAGDGTAAKADLSKRFEALQALAK